MQMGRGKAIVCTLALLGLLLFIIASFDSGTITFTANLVNQWESGGESFYHYTLTIHNRSGFACTQWTVDIPFNAAVVLTDSWNGNYSVNGKTIRISSKDYNGNIPAGEICYGSKNGNNLAYN